MTQPHPSPTPLADLPAGKQVDVAPDENIVTMSDSQSRLRLAMQKPDDILSDKVTVAESTDSFSRLRGVQNPYGTGLRAYEPNTTLLQDYENAFNAVQDSKAQAAAAAQAKQDNSITVNGTNNAVTSGDFAGGGILNGSGKVAAMVSAALALAAKNTPYVWGGTSANGVDCSGLVYYAAQAAGIQGVKRWRAVDYGKLGTQVSSKDARPGDLVYYDEPGDTDHVGIYLGGGKMVAAPQSGENVKVQNVYGTPSFRRVFNDDSYGTTAMPDGSYSYNYNNNVYDPAARFGDSTGKILRTTGGGRVYER